MTSFSPSRLLAAFAVSLAAIAAIAVVAWPSGAPRPSEPAKGTPPIATVRASPQGAAVAREFAGFWALAITRGMSDAQLKRGTRLLERPELSEAIAPPDHDHEPIAPDASIPDGRISLRVEVVAAQEGQVITIASAIDSEGTRQQIEITTALTDRGWLIVELDDPTYRRTQGAAA